MRIADPTRPAAETPAARYRATRREIWTGAIPFITVHALALLSIVTGVRPVDVAVCLALYAIRMFAVTGGYHRYFSHRTYKTSRVFQFFLAFLAQTSAQKGALWWAAHHRTHHKYSDQPQDMHSPRQKGVWYAHLGWLFDGTAKTDYDRVKDLSRYPELVWLNEHWLLPAVALGFGVWAGFGWSGLWFGFMASTVLLWHGTFTINSLSHVFGSQRYETGDDSRNHLLLALITFGEGWHNNHHYYQASTRQGFRWWQIDVTYMILKLLSLVGLVWDLREPPASVIGGTWRPRRRADSGTSPSVPAAAT